MKSPRFILPALILCVTSLALMSSSAQAQQAAPAEPVKNTTAGVEIIRNGDFKTDSENWRLEQVAPAQGELLVVNEGPNGSSCAKVRLVEAGDVHWKLSFIQTGFGVKANKSYRISFLAKANQDRWVSVDFKQHGEPYKGLGGKYDVHIGTSWTAVNLVLKPSADEPNARFSVGNLGQILGTLWFTNFSVIEE